MHEDSDLRNAIKQIHTRQGKEKGGRGVGGLEERRREKEGGSERESRKEGERKGETNR